ncbi:MAG: hypothetical protein ACKVQR_22670 [Aquabacterium sp.]
MAWLLAAFVACAVAAPAAPPAKVFKCGPDGRTFSQTPCPAGQEVPSTDTRTPAQQREAAAIATREKGLAEDLARERRQREKAAVGQRAVGIGPDAGAPVAKGAASGPGKGQGKGRLGKASAPQADGGAPVYQAPKPAPVKQP